MTDKYGDDNHRWARIMAERMRGIIIQTRKKEMTTEACFNNIDALLKEYGL